MLRNVFEWFGDKDNGGIRRFYVLLGIAFLGFFIYTNYFRLNDYDEINQERINLMRENEKHIAREAALEKELEYMKVEITRATNALVKNKKIDEREKQIIADMSIRDKLDYLARAGYVSASTHSDRDDAATR